MDLPSVVFCRQPLSANLVFAVWPDEMLTAKNSTDGKSHVSRSDIHINMKKMLLGVFLKLKKKCDFIHHGFFRYI